MRSAKDFFRPLAVGAPEPLRAIPFRPSRMIHFFDPSNEKMAAKVPDIAAQVDVILGNLEDAVAADSFPNVDLALAALMHAYDMRPDAGETIFALARVAGWLAHAIEEYREPGLRFRPLGVYSGVRPER